MIIPHAGTPSRSAPRIFVLAPRRLARRARRLARRARRARRAEFAGAKWNSTCLWVTVCFCFRASLCRRSRMLLCTSRSKARRPIETRHVGAARRTHFGPAQADASATATGSGGVFRGGAAATAPARETRFGPAQGTAAARGVHFRPAQAGATTTATGSEVTLFGPAQAGAAATATARGTHVKHAPQPELHTRGCAGTLQWRLTQSTLLND